MKNINSNNVIFEMTKDNKPALYCNSGDIVIFHTLDCFSNKLLPPKSKLGVDNPKVGNPSTGPLYIENALPGDTLKIEIMDIEVGNLGVNLIESQNKILLNVQDKFEVRRIPVENGKAKLTSYLNMPIEPMIGVIGVAPKEANIPTALPGKHGGNMDCSQIKKGAVLYLPVYIEGALLSIGDLHALMGDGEIGECGLEIEGKVKVRVSVIPKMQKDGPIISIDDKWITIASCNTLEEASQEAARMMIELLIKDGGVETSDASLMLNLVGNINVCQLCNMYKTVRMELSKECFVNKEFFQQ